jgi:dTDP-glucose 4,6-dehydratase
MRDVVVGGTHHVFAAGRSSGVGRALLISSGAVYGPQPAHERIPEDAGPADEPEPGRQAYAAAKAAAEFAALESGVGVVIARPFAFLGPHLPLGAGFAAGQFLDDALAGRPIRVADGTVVRSYLYAADLAAWLWTLLVAGRPGRAYNVGSEHAVTLTALAAMIAGTFRPPREIERGWHASGHRYVPDTRRAREELGLAETVSLPEAVRRTLRWHREAGRATPGR